MTYRGIRQVIMPIPVVWIIETAQQYGKVARESRYSLSGFHTSKHMDDQLSGDTVPTEEPRPFKNSQERNSLSSKCQYCKSIKSVGYNESSIKNDFKLMLSLNF